MNFIHSIYFNFIRIDGTLEDINEYEGYLGKPEASGVSPFGEWTAYWVLTE